MKVNEIEEITAEKRERRETKDLSVDIEMKRRHIDDKASSILKCVAF